MPTYEMPIIFKVMSKPETVEALKRTAETIFKAGGFIRKIDNLGKQPTPYKMGKKYLLKEASYFIYNFDLSPKKLDQLKDEYKRDIDVLRSKIYNKDENKEIVAECTLHEELLPPPYRADVQQMMEVGRIQKLKRERGHFKFNTGLDYYPFQR